MLALLATTLGSIVTPTFAGWDPAHGHVSASGVVGPHTHPWDEPARSVSNASSINPDEYCSLHGAPHRIALPVAENDTTSTDGESSLVFTMGTGGTVTGVSAPALPAGSQAMPPRPVVVAATDLNQVMAPGSFASQVPVPPPRV